MHCTERCYNESIVFVPRPCIITSIDSYKIGLIRVFLLDNVFKIVLLLYNSLLHLLLLTHLNVLALIDALKITETRKENKRSRRYM